MSEALEQIMRHNRWANLKLVDVCSALTDAQLDASAAGTYGRIRDTLLHLFVVEERYVGLLTGQPIHQPLKPTEGLPSFAVLREHANRSGDGLVALAANFQPNQILQGAWRSEPYSVMAIVPLIQAINHGTEHRAHVVTILSQLGIEPPALDGWAYGREVLGQGSPGVPSPSK